MIIDTSAIVALIRGEPEARAFTELLEAAPRKFIAAPNYLELCMVVTGDRDEEAVRQIDALLARAGISILAFTPEMAAAAVGAFLRYGKGRDRAGLNFGDCIAYAASKTELMPLLFKGDDFRQTDVDCAA